MNSLITNDNMSIAEKIALLPKDKQAELMGKYSAKELEALKYDWKFWGRPKQILPKGDWFLWMVLAGRGFGKTRTGAETVKQWWYEGTMIFALVGKTIADIRDVMLNGESGLLNPGMFPKNDRPEYVKSLRAVKWPNGAIAYLYSDEDPDQLRGPQHEKAWVDELVKFRNAADMFDMLEMGMRLGDKPQIICTTTPKPTKLLKSILDDDTTYLTTGSTYENVGNLPAKFINRIVKKYEGTRLGDQELHAAVLHDAQGSLWTRGLIERQMVHSYPELIRITVAVDPSTTFTETSDECGITVQGIDVNRNAYLLADYTIKAPPIVWATAVVDAFVEWRADRIVYEQNQGGDIIPTVLATIKRNLPVKAVHASRGKDARAEPISTLYEQNKIFHVNYFPEMENEMCTWVPGDRKSPNRIDALVWGMTDLLIDSKVRQGMRGVAVGSSKDRARGGMGSRRYL